MTLKKFGDEDIIYSTIVANPKYSFLIQNSKVYRNNEILTDGDFGNKLKHITNGQISFHELNVNRPSDSLIYGFISQDTTRYSYSTIATSDFNVGGDFAAGMVVTQSYPLKAGLTRIYIAAGDEFDNNQFNAFEPPSFAGSNKKYIRSLTSVVNSRDHAGKPIEYADLGTKKINMVCIPGIFYGSSIEKGSIELNCYVSGNLVGQIKDSNKDGHLIQTTGAQSGSAGGIAIYEQGLLLLTGSWDLSGGSVTADYGDYSHPAWLNFGTGLPFVGASDEGAAPTEAEIEHTTFEVKFRGTNRIPTLTMMAYAEKGDLNYSNNPTFLLPQSKSVIFTSSSFSEPQRTIKNITKSRFDNHSASFQSTTFISKVGIYDENKNLIAIATMARPLKKTPDRDYMIKMRMDF